MKILSKKSKSIFILFLLASTLLFGLASSPVLGAVGLELNFVDLYTDSLTPSSRNSIAITRDNLYYLFMNTTNLEAHAVSDQSLVNSLAGITAGANQLIIPSSFTGDASDLVYTTDPDSGTVWKLISYDVSSDTDTVICSDWYDGSSATTKKVYMLSQSYDNKYMVISHDDGGIEQINMDVGTKIRSFANFENGLCSPNSLRMIAFNCYSGNPTHVVKMNLQTGLEVANTSLGILSPYSTSDTRYLDGFGWNRWYENYYYASFYNVSDNTQFCYVRINDDLSTYSILIDDSDYWGTNAWRHDITRDGEYIIVTAEGNLDSVLYDNDGTIIATGVNRIQTPTFSYDGSYIVGYRTTTKEIYGYNTDYTIVGGGQDTPDLSAYDIQCPDGSFYSAETINDKYLEMGVTNFGDITINAVELFVSGQQYNLDNNKDNYILYVNGDLCGNADYFYQADAFFYDLVWDGLSINAGTDTIILEFGVDHTPILDWHFLPMRSGTFSGNALSHSTTGNFGDGFATGQVIHGGYSLSHCIYYTINAPTFSNNTYNIEMLSTDPHYQGNISEFKVTVTGAEDWFAIITDNNGDIILKESYDGNGVYLVSKFLLWYFETGVYTFFALDVDAYPSGLLTAENETFTVSDGSAHWDDYELAVENTVLGTGERQYWYWKAPSGTNLTIRVVAPQGGTSLNFTRYGTGSWEYGTSFICNAGGQWEMYIIDWQYGIYGVMKTIYFSVTDTGGNYIEVDISPVCLGEYPIAVSGMYLGNDGELWYYLNNNSYYVFPLSYGEFYNAQMVDEIGLWSIYITSNGTVEDWSKVSCLVEDCDIPDTGAYLDIYALMTSLPSLYRIIIGVVIIFLLTISPLAVISKLELKQQIDIPPVLYAVMGGVGLCVSTLIGCWGWEIPFMVFALIVMGMFGKFYYDKRGG